MGVLFPLFLGGAAAAVLPLCLHLLRRWPRRPVVFPSLRFLAPSGRQTESFRQRLQRWLVLLLRCASFGLLAAAFARPFRNGQLARQTRAVVVVVDNSFSLQATGRWNAARAWALSQVGKLEPGDQLGIVLMAPQPTWKAPVTFQTEGPLEELRQLEPGWLSSRAEPALRLAGDALARLSADRREIIVLTDHQRLSWSGTDFTQPLPPGVAVSFPDPAAAITRQAALGPPVIRRTPAGLAASVPIRNFTGPQRRILSVYQDGGGKAVRTETLDLGRFEDRTQIINLPGGEKAARFRFSLDPDDLPADDASYAVWTPSADGRVLLDPSPAEAQADFVRTALDAASAVKPSLKLEPVPAGAWPLEAVALLRSDASFAGEQAARLDAYLASGGAALVFATGGPAQRAWLEAHNLSLVPLPERAEPWEVRDWDLANPLVASLSQRRLGVLLGWNFTRGWSLPGALVQPLAHWTEQKVAIGEARIDSGRLLLCGFAPDRSGGDWPVTPAFVPFLHQAMAHLFQVRQSAPVGGRAGSPLPLPAELGKWRAVDGPGSGRPAVDASASIVPTEPGIYEFLQGGDRRLYAVNLPAEESDPTVWPGGEPWKDLVAKVPPPPGKMPRAQLAAADAEQRAPLWWWAIAAAALLILLELVLSNRTAR